ncbi:hypothetical protein M885DRAFT_610273 [Pelagophyceae sp. CCMP2097]|nr:hypothetical protein M885DRAFT_610273 [Pelagophyceae sp. CCMP2097]
MLDADLTAEGWRVDHAFVGRDVIRSTGETDESRGTIFAWLPSTVDDAFVDSNGVAVPLFKVRFDSGDLAGGGEDLEISDVVASLVTVPAKIPPKAKAKAADVEWDDAPSSDEAPEDGDGAASDDNDDEWDADDGTGKRKRVADDDDDDDDDDAEEEEEEEEEAADTSEDEAPRKKAKAKKARAPKAKSPESRRDDGTASDDDAPRKTRGRAAKAPKPRRAADEDDDDDASEASPKKSRATKAPTPRSRRTDDDDDGGDGGGDDGGDDGGDGADDGADDADDGEDDAAFEEHRAAARLQGFYAPYPDFDAHLRHALKNAGTARLDELRAHADSCTDTVEAAALHYVATAVDLRRQQTLKPAPAKKGRNVVVDDDEDDFFD